MARLVWADQTLSQDSDLTPLEAQIASWGVTSLANKHTLAKNEIARLLRLRYADLKAHVDPVQEGDDGQTGAAGTTFTAPGAAFTTRKVSTSHRLWIENGSDKGVYTFTGVTATTLTGVSPAFTATASALSYYIEPDVLDLIKNPAVLTPAAAFLALHYAAVELIHAPGDHYDVKQDFYRRRFEQTFKEVAPDLLLDLDQDDVISSPERRMGITGGNLIR